MPRFLFRPALPRAALLLVVVCRFSQPSLRAPVCFSGRSGRSHTLFSRLFPGSAPVPVSCRAAAAVPDGFPGVCPMPHGAVSRGPLRFLSCFVLGYDRSPGAYAAAVPGLRIHSRSSTAQKRAGRQMFSTSRARAKSGAICSGLKPAMPHPISVTRNLSCGLRRAKSMKSST